MPLSRGSLTAYKLDSHSGAEKQTHRTELAALLPGSHLAFSSPKAGLHFLTVCHLPSPVPAACP